MQGTSPPAVIRLRTDALDAWAAREGLPNDTATAERIGVSPSTLWRIVNDEVVPGEKFIAAALAVTGRKFEELFEVVPGDAA
jgi:hypothetical protein